MDSGRDIIVIAGPSGVGKDSIIREQRKYFPRMGKIVTCTTRTPRTDQNGYTERNGIDYFFHTPEEFEAKVAAGEFLEHAPVGAYRYGTPISEILKLRAEGNTLLFLNIDVQGAERVKNACPESTSVFLLPPSRDVLYQRLVDRNSETEQQREDRMSNAVEQISRAHECDYVLVNDDLSEASEKVRDIILHRHDRKPDPVDTVLIDRILATFPKE